MQLARRLFRLLAVLGMASAGLPAAAHAHAGAPPGCKAFDVPDAPGRHNGGIYYQCTIDTERFPDALCNDGTPGVFQVQFAAMPSTKWVFWLAGGAQCETPASCTARARNSKTHQLVTSRGLTPRPGQALLSHDPSVDPDLARANTVLVRYCSSDAWSGQHRAGNGPDGWSPYDVSTWNFMGRAVATAAVRTLGSLGVGFLDATEVVLGGTSAGAFGITVTANDIVPILPAGARVLFVQDAGFTVSLGRFDDTAPSPYVHIGTTSPFQKLMRQGTALWQARGDRLCDAQARTSAAHLACLDTTVILHKPWIEVPKFVAFSTLDQPTVQAQLCPPLGRCLAPHDPATPAGIYTTYLAKRTAQELSESGAATLPYTAFSPDAYVHSLLDVDSAFTTRFAFGAGPLSARDAFGAWYSHPNQAGGARVGTGPGVQ